MTRAFGFDVGTTSVGFAVIDFDEDRGDGTIQHTGVRIFPEGVTEKLQEPRNKQRRDMRLMRRQTRRRRLRRNLLRTAFAEAGLLPAWGTDEWKKLMDETDPYALRARGLSEPLAPQEVGRALYHLVKRRGFASPRLEDESDEEKRKEEGKVRTAIGELASDMGDRPLGAHLAKLDKKRGRYIGRDMVMREFEELWAAQACHHPKLLTPEARKNLHDIAFYQRPIFWRLGTLGTCRLEPDSPLCLKGSWLGQQFLMLQRLNSLRLAGGNERRLTDDEREKAFAFLQCHDKATFAKLRTLLGLPRTQKFNFEIGGEKSIPGDAVETHLIKIFGESWADHPAGNRLRDEIHKRLRAIDYARIGNKRVEIRRTDEAALERRAFLEAAPAEYGITSDEAEALAEITLPSGWLRHSEKAIRRLIPHLEEGKVYSDAVDAAYPGHREAEAEMLNRLPSHPRHMPDLRNPTVARALTELRKVTNNLIRAFGKPDVIRIEFARELRQSKKQRLKTQKRMRQDEKRRQEARKHLEKNDIANPSRGDIEKCLLWWEASETCPYTGQKISFDALFRRGQFQIEHILPRSRSLDNSYMNKTLCEKRENELKGNRTPFEFYSNQPEKWDAIGQRLESLVKNGFPEGKRRRFLRREFAEVGSEEFGERQLRDTAYTAREARKFLQRLGVSVEPVNGRITSQLAYRWGLYSVVGEGRGKDRTDHRHHAVDALAVACTSRAFVKRLSDAFAGERAFKEIPLPEPWPDFREDVRYSMERIVVSHRVRRKVSGALHKQTVVADTGETAVTSGVIYNLFVTRVALDSISDRQIEDIRDTEIRKLVRKHVANNGGKAKGAFPPYPELVSKKTGELRPIKRVRILVKQQKDLMVPLNARTRAYAVAGDNHHMAIYERDDGKVEFEVVSLFEATRRKAAGEPIIRRRNGPSRFIMSLAPGDMIAFPPGSGAPNYCIVQSVWSNGQIELKEHTQAERVIWSRPNPRSLLRSQGSKVSVDPIGRVRPAHD